MKTISLWQPWATAIAVGVKRVETRHWPTRYRGVLAIHAAKRWTGGQRHFTMSECACGRLPARIPLGAIVAIARLVDCRPAAAVALDVSAVERIYGNYEPGRFAWMLEDIAPLAEPIPWRGSQGFFEVPDDIIPKAAMEAMGHD